MEKDICKTGHKKSKSKSAKMSTDPPSTARSLCLHVIKVPILTGQYRMCVIIANYATIEKKKEKQTKYSSITITFMIINQLYKFIMGEALLAGVMFINGLPLSGKGRPKECWQRTNSTPSASLFSTGVPMRVMMPILATTYGESVTWKQKEPGHPRLRLVLAVNKTIRHLDAVFGQS